MKRALLLSALLLLACGPKDEVRVLRDDHCPVGGCKDASTVGDGGPVVIPPEPLEPWDETGQGLLSGIFAVETTINARVGIPVETRQLFRLRIRQLSSAGARRALALVTAQPARGTHRTLRAVRP